MTLIAAVFSRAGSVVTVSDLAISPGAGPGIKQLLPMEALKSTLPGADLNEVNSFVGAEHKAVQFGDHLILWTGLLEVAQKLIRGLFAVQESLNEKNIKKHCAAIEADWKQSVKVIYLRNVRGSIRLWHNCSLRRDTEGGFIVADGSAGPAFLDCVPLDKAPYTLSDDKSLAEALGRVSKLLASELLDESFPSKIKAGIAYEFTVVSGKGFRKVPYNIMVCAGRSRSFGVQGYIDIDYRLSSTLIRLMNHTPNVIRADNWVYSIPNPKTLQTIQSRLILDFLRDRGKEVENLRALSDVTLQGRLRGIRIFSFIFLLKVNDEGDLSSIGGFCAMPALSSNHNLGEVKAAVHCPSLQRMIESYFLDRVYSPPKPQIRQYQADFGITVPTFFEFASVFPNRDPILDLF